MTKLQLTIHHSGLTYGLEAILQIQFEVMTLRIVTKMRLELNESQWKRLAQLNVLDELQLKVRLGSNKKK